MGSIILPRTISHTIAASFSGHPGIIPSTTIPVITRHTIPVIPGITIPVIPAITVEIITDDKLSTKISSRVDQNLLLAQHGLP